MSVSENKINSITYFLIVTLTITTVYILQNEQYRPRKIYDFVHKNKIIKRNELFGIIYKYENNFYNTHNLFNIKIVDSQYYTIKQTSLEHFLTLNKINEIQYMNNTMDCDNFSIELYATIKRMEKFYEHSLLFGLIVGKEINSDTTLHAINFFIGHNHSILMCVEPQNDKIDHCYKMLKTISFIMV